MKMADIEKIREVFKRDRFATSTGIEILEGERGHAKCRLVLEDVHRNANGAVMGGVLFTLADFCTAVASNVDLPRCVSIDGEIRFIASSKGNVLYAVCDAEKIGRTLSFYKVKITDDQDQLVATASFTSMCVSEDSLTD